MSNRPVTGHSCSGVYTATGAQFFPGSPPEHNSDGLTYLL